MTIITTKFCRTSCPANVIPRARVLKCAFAVYNGDGQRVSIVDSQGTKKPIWDGENILLETDGMTIFVVYSCASDERSFSRPSR